MRYIMAIDQGTTGTRVFLIDRQGEVHQQCYKEFTQIYPQPGWVEHDPEEIWECTREVIQNTLRQGGVTPSDIHAIGITNQRETTVLWDRKTGKAVHNAIVWQCRRTAPICDKMKADGLTDTVRQKTGLVIDAYFSATKIAWLLNNVPGVRDRAARGELAFGTIDTWLLYKLTAGKRHATDYTNASRTMIYDIHNKRWDEELLKVLGIPALLLPEVKPSSTFFGTTAAGVFGAEVPVAGIAGDQQSALYGQGCFAPGSGKNTYGTGCFLLLNTGENACLSRQGLLTTLACGADGSPVYALEGSVFITGAVVQWLRDGLKIISHARETEAIAKSVDNTGGVYIVPAFAGLGAPYWDSEARGIISGLTRGSGRAEIVRAALESIAYQTKDVVEIMNAESGVPLTKLNVDGGAAQNDFLMQFQADLLGVPVDRPRMTETTVLGAAFLAGLSSGFWKNASELAGVRSCERIFQPDMPREKRDRLYGGWKQAVARARYQPRL